MAGLFHRKQVFPTELTLPGMFWNNMMEHKRSSWNGPTEWDSSQFLRHSYSRHLPHVLQSADSFPPINNLVSLLTTMLQPNGKWDWSTRGSQLFTWSGLQLMQRYLEYLFMVTWHNFGVRRNRSSEVKLQEMFDFPRSLPMGILHWSRSIIFGRIQCNALLKPPY